MGREFHDADLMLYYSTCSNNFTVPLQIYTTLEAKNNQATVVHV